jgi:hypothetical protein
MWSEVTAFADNNEIQPISGGQLTSAAIGQNHRLTQSEYMKLMFLNLKPAKSCKRF